jgi:Ca2+-binding RTX toxin-like protein
MSSISWSLSIDRDAGVFDVNVDYTIDGYSDPETGEYFGDTSWNWTVGAFGTGGFSSEGAWVNANIGLGWQEVFETQFSFSAQNTFSGESLSLVLPMLLAPAGSTALLIDGGASGEIIVTGSGNDTIHGNGGDDFVEAGAGADVLEGNAGNDSLNGGRGADLMNGGAGDDYYTVDNVNDTIVEAAGEGTDTAYALVDYTLDENVERLILASFRSLDGTGNSGDNYIEGTGLFNALAGLGGNDTLIAHEGNDLLSGGDGDDWLDGGAGKDQMDGGAGDDTYVVDRASDQIVDVSGNDTVRSTLFNYTLTEPVENLWILQDNGRGVGNELANVLQGASGSNVLDGAGGNDTLNGGGGNDILVGGAGADVLNGDQGFDTASYASAAAPVYVDLQAGGSLGYATGDTYNSIENATGSAGADVLRGNINANTLDGGDGDDTLLGLLGDDVLIGGAGNDQLAGGDGRDVVSYRGSTAAVTVDLATQIATGGDATGDFLIGFEGAAGGLGDDTLSGDAGANALFGDAGADTLDGGGGNDIIDGGANADTMSGGAGTDRLSYASSAAGVTVDLLGGLSGGGDADGDAFSGFEDLVGSRFADTLTGDDGANRIWGGAGNDHIFAGAGNDVVFGGDGPDVMDGGAGIDTLSYRDSDRFVVASLENGIESGGESFSAFERLTGSSFGDVLYGDAGANVIRGGNGGDFINGRDGNDRLNGGEGADTFHFDVQSDHDVVVDFEAGAGDTFQLDLGSQFDSFAEVMAVATEVDGSTVFDFMPGIRVTLLGVQMAELGAGDFVFA